MLVLTFFSNTIMNHSCLRWRPSTPSPAK
jgi:hypothetical protein